MITQQAFTWANVYPDLCRHMASVGHNGLMSQGLLEGKSALVWVIMAWHWTGADPLHEPLMT